MFEQSQSIVNIGAIFWIINFFFHFFEIVENLVKIVGLQGVAKIAHKGFGLCVQAGFGALPVPKIG